MAIRPRSVYWGMILLLAVCSAVLAAFPAASPLLPAGGQMPASPLVMAAVTFLLMAVVYGGLGYVGLELSAKVGFAGIWAPEVTNRERFVLPFLAGAGLGVFFVVTDLALAPIHGLGRIPHPPFPVSVGASVTAGIGEEVLFRLFFISFWVWLISSVILKGRGADKTFGAVTGASAVLFTVAHFPAVMLLMGLEGVEDIPLIFAVEMFLLNGALSVVAAVFMRRWGILAAVGLHFWTDAVWHVVWGLVSGT